MSRDTGESSSDVERARQLSIRLGSHDEAPAQARPPAAIPYIRFDAGRFAGPAPGPLPPRAERPPPPESDDWAALLGWIRALCAADAAFLIDVRGLLVAASGDVPKERAEGMGARLVLAFEHADRMEADAQRSRSMVIDFGGAVLTGIRIPLPEGETLVLGIASRTLPDLETRAEVERALTRRAVSG